MTDLSKGRERSYTSSVCGLRLRLLRLRPLASAAVRSVSLVLLRHGNSDKTKADVAVPGRRLVPGPEPGPAVRTGPVPAAPVHPDRAHLGRSPLPHVAVHVAEPQLVRRIRADARR